MPSYSIQVNGQARTVDAPETASLLYVLRDLLELTGTKYGCGEGQCGACTVLVDAKPVRSCLLAISQVGQQPVETVEGLATANALHPLQQAFLDHAAFQCGFCTPGMLMAAKALLAENPKPSPDDIRAGMNGNICRCGTYGRIVAAIQQAAQGGTRA